MAFQNNSISYEKSNKILTVSKKSFSKKEFSNLLKATDDEKDRQKKGQILIDYLSKSFDIPSPTLKVHHKPQAHTDNSKGNLKSKTYGTYSHPSMVIDIFNLTAKQQKPVAIKTFADTLLHEFMHHYDYRKIKLEKSLHTLGFYKRISDLKSKLSD